MPCIHQINIVNQRNLENGHYMVITFGWISGLYLSVENFKYPTFNRQFVRRKNVHDINEARIRTLQRRRSVLDVNKNVHFLIGLS